MSNTTTTQSGGIGFLGLLTIVFIVLKLTGYIAWSWLWVLSPLWIPIAVFVVLAILFVLVLAVADAVKSRRVARGFKKSGRKGW